MDKIFTFNYTSIGKKIFCDIYYPSYIIYAEFYLKKIIEKQYKSPSGEVVNALIKLSKEHIN